MKAKRDFWCGIFSALFGLVLILIIPSYVRVSRGLTEVNERFFPYFAAIALLIMGIMLAGSNYFLLKKQKEIVQEDKDSRVEKKDIIRVLWAAILMFVYIFIIPIVGFLPTTFVVMVIFMLLLGIRNWKLVLLVCIGLTLSIHYIFQVFMRIHLPIGFLGI